MQIPADINQRYRQINIAEAVVKFFVFDQCVLEEEYAGQNQQHDADGDDVRHFFLPQLFPNHALRIIFGRANICIGGCRVGGSTGSGCWRINRHGRAVRIVHRERLRHLIVQINGHEGFVLYAQFMLNHQLQAPRFGRVERKIFRCDKQRNLFEMRCALGKQIQQAGVVQVGKAEAVVVLNHFDTVKNTATHIARTFPGIHAFTGHDNGGLVGFQTRLQLGKTAFAQ